MAGVRRCHDGQQYPDNGPGGRVHAAWAGIWIFRIWCIFSLLKFFSAMWKTSLILITVMADDEPASDVKIIRLKIGLQIHFPLAQSVLPVYYNML